MEYKEPKIHPSSIVHKLSEIGEGTTIGPFCIIEEGVKIGKNCKIQHNVTIRGITTIGDGTNIFPFAFIGGEPQHIKYSGEPTRVEIGNNVTLREFVTIHRGTSIGTGLTKIGDGSYLMAYTHIAHDCEVGKNVIMANATQLAGHSSVGDFCVIGGLSGISQFCRVGNYCFIGGCSIIRKDLPPYLSGKGNEFRVQGINAVGLKRNSFTEESILLLRKIFKVLYLQNITTAKAIEVIENEFSFSPFSREFVEFIRTSKMGIIR